MGLKPLDKLLLRDIRAAIDAVAPDLNALPVSAGRGGEIVLGRLCPCCVSGDFQRVMKILNAAGFGCTRLRAHLSVMRAGKRSALGKPDPARKRRGRTVAKD